MHAQLLNLPSYSFNIYAVPTAATAFLMLFLISFALIYERASSVSISLSLIAFFICIWFFAFSWMYCSNNPGVALWWAKCAYLGVPFIPSSVFCFSVTILRIYPRFRKMVWGGWIVSALLSATILNTNALVKDVYHYGWGYYPAYGWLSLPYLLFFAGMMLTSLYLFITEYRKVINDTHRRRIRSLVMAICIGSVSSVDYFAKFGIKVYPFGFLPISFFVLFLVAAMVKYRLVDITPAFAADHIVRILNDALIVCNDEGIIQIANNATFEMLGFSEPELLGKRLNVLFQPPPSELKSSGTFLWKEEKQNQEMIFYTKQGKPVDVSISISVLRDSAKVPAGAVIIARDITEHKREQKALEKSLSIQQATLESTTDGILVVDLEGKIASFNHRFLEMWRIPEKVIVSKDDSQALAFVLDQLKDPENFMKKVEDLYRQTDLESYDTLDFNDGRCFERYSKPQRLGGMSVGRVWSFRDVTERRRLERLRDDFLSTVSHELRTPLTIIKEVIYNVMAHMEGPLTGGQSRLLSIADRNVSRLAKIVNDLLDLSRLESGKVKMNKILVRVDEMIKICVQNFAIIAESVKKTIEIKIDSEALIEINADAEMIVRVFNNLLDNALRYARSRVTVKAKLLGDDGNNKKVELPHLKISIIDDGNGIPTEHIQYLFNKFHQVNRPVGGSAYKGTGLGLAISKEIIELHQGKIWVESSAGHGSEFHFILPLN